jgi:hypothetical protein
VNPAVWDHQSQANLSCDAGLDAAVTRRSPRHYYSFPGVKGQTGTFFLRGSWSPALGAIVLVTDGSYKVLAAKSVSWGTQVSVDAKFVGDSKHFVFVGPLRTYTSNRAAAYDLKPSCTKPACTQTSECGYGEQCHSGACVAQPLCVQLEPAAGKHVVKNFAAGQWKEANDWGTANANGLAWGISLATCGTVAQNLACTEQYDPYCTVSNAWTDARTLGNACEVKRAILEAAGDYAEITGISQKGAFATSGSPRCGTYYVDTAYYAKNWNSDFEANAWIGLNPNAKSSAVLGGACDSFTICNRLYAPVCGGVKSEAPHTYGNRCSFETAVRIDAGSTGESKGYAKDGACQ